MSTIEQEELGWCIVELFGRKKLAGYVRELAGGMLEVRIYDEDPDQDDAIEAIGSPRYGAAAIYAIHPVSKQTALAAANARGFRYEPVARWELPEPDEVAPVRTLPAGTPALYDADEDAFDAPLEPVDEFDEPEDDAGEELDALEAERAASQPTPLAASEVQRYQERGGGPVLTAIEYTGTNDEAVMEFGEGLVNYRDNDEGMVIESLTSPTQQFAEEGDWILKDADGRVRTLTATEFADKYELEVPF